MVDIRREEAKNKRRQDLEISADVESEKGAELKENFGGPFRARTGDPLIKSQLLYQLS